jgi:type I restriction enzyme, S subunit
MPEGPMQWPTMRIGSFAAVRRGASPRPIDNPRWFSPEGPGWVRIRDVTAAGDRLRETEDHLSTEGAARSVRVGPGDVIMSIAATIGLTIIVDMDARIHDGFVKISPDGSVDPGFLVRVLRHSKAEFLARGQTGTQSNINSQIVAGVLVRVPPLEEQRRIAEILDTIDETIQATERVIAKLELARRGLREQFCTPDGSAPGPAHLSAMVEAVVDCPHSTPEYLDSGVLVARTMHIKNGRFRTESASRVSEASYQDRIARMVPSPGDVVLTREAPVGEAFAVPDRMRICLGQRVVLVRPGTALVGQYLVELIYSNQGQRQIRRLSAGTTNPHLNVDDIRDLAFDVPGPEVQRSALRTLVAATSEMDAEQAKLEKLKRTRSGLAADLLSGLVRTVGA